MKIKNGSELQQQNQEYLNDVTGLQNMFRSLAIRFKRFLVADSSQRKSYYGAIVAEFKKVLNEQETEDAKDERENSEEEVIKQFRVFFSVLS